jgi:ribosomal protein S18 acetylase RimI-like enzyme
MEAITIRVANADDYDELIAVWKASGSEISPRGRETRAAFVRHVERFPGLSLVALDGGQVVGVVLGSHDGRKGWISRLAVLPTYRRRGVAAELVTVCDTAIRAKGIEIVAALVEVDNPASAALFRKLGYSDEIPVHYFRKLSHSEA